MKTNTYLHLVVCFKHTIYAVCVQASSTLNITSVVLILVE